MNTVMKSINVICFFNDTATTEIYTLSLHDALPILRHPSVEEVFQWKQQHVKSQGEEIFQFNRAEDRLAIGIIQRSEEHTSELQSRQYLVCRLLLEKKNPQLTSAVVSHSSLSLVILC